MTQRSTQSRAGSRYASLRLLVLGLCVAVSILSGCAGQKRPKARSFPWASAKAARPVLPSSAAASQIMADEFLMETSLDVPPPPSSLTAVPNGPPRPRVPSVASGPSAASRPEPPQIAPQLTAQETAAAQQQTNLSLSIAERNIAASQGRALNATQSDLASKVRSFVAEARDAAHVGDWTRASNAAKKAQVLSEELARSL
jgi:hypothetical protein